MHAPRALHPAAPAGATPAASPTLSARGDRFEREADLAAEQVLSGQTRPQLTRLSEAPIQREGDRKKEPPSPAGEGLATVGENLGENNPAFSAFTEQLADRFLAQPAPISVGIPTFLGANYAFLWGMAMVNPAMRRSFDDFNLALLPGLVPQFPVKTFQYRILDNAQTRFAFEVGLDASELMTAFNEGVLNTRVSTLKFDTGGTLDTDGPKAVSLSALKVQMGLFGDGVLLSGGFRNGISPYPLMGEDGSRVMAQTPALPDLYADQRDVRFTLSLDLVKLADHFGGTPPAPRKAESLQRKASDGAPVADATSAVRPALAAGGQPLDSGTRSFMESRFGHEFGKVRIHADAGAAASARALHAHAYTVGSDIVFATGEYAPQTVKGKRLLAHELAHVVQQQATQVAIQRQERRPAAVDENAQRIIDLAQDNSRPIEERSVEVVRAIINQYYPNDASKVSRIRYVAEESGLHITYAGTGATTTGQIDVGRYFVENTTQRHFARRIAQVRHEIEHVEQQRAGMTGEGRQDEREFLAFYHEALFQEPEGAGRMQHSSRVMLIDAALGYFFCLSADLQRDNESKRDELRTRRTEAVRRSGRTDAGDAPTTCRRQSH